MTRNAEKIYRDVGALSWGGTDIGYNSTDKPGIAVMCSRLVEDGFVEWHGQTRTNIWQIGWDIKVRVFLTQHDANTIATAFPGLTTGTAITINDQTIKPGVDLANTVGQYGQFLFEGNSFNITGYKAVPLILVESMVASAFSTWEYGLDFLLVPDASDNILKIDLA